MPKTENSKERMNPPPTMTTIKPVLMLSSPVLLGMRRVDVAIDNIEASESVGFGSSLGMWQAFVVLVKRQIKLKSGNEKIMMVQVVGILCLTAGIEGLNVCSAAAPSLKEKGDRFKIQNKEQIFASLATQKGESEEVGHLTTKFGKSQGCISITMYRVWDIGII